MIDELYGASSLIARLQHEGVAYRDVEVEWICAHRARPIASYSTLIADYTRLIDTERDDAERYMDELFTAAELDVLRVYLAERQGLEIAVSVIPIPMEVRPASVGFIATPARRMIAADQSGHFGWYLREFVDAALPFTVAAWYFVDQAGSTNSLV